MLSTVTGTQIDLNEKGIGEINDIFSQNTYQLEKMAYKFGMSREEIVALQSVTQGLEENLAAQERLKELQS